MTETNPEIPQIPQILLDAYEENFMKPGPSPFDQPAPVLRDAPVAEEILLTPGLASAPDEE